LSLRITVVLVRPKEDGNVGAIARIARNFGATRLILVQPRAKIGSVARRRAMVGLDLLKEAKRVVNLDRAIGEVDLVVGTTDLSSGRSNNYLRRSVSPERLGEMLRPLTGKVAVVFGPEDDGLLRTELERCDLLVHIPTRRDAPTLNVSHAAGVVLYAIHRAQGPDSDETTPAPEEFLLNGPEKELLLERVRDLATKAGYPPHKRRGLILLVRRVLGRATPTEAEYRMLLGFLRSVDRLSRNQRGGKRRVA